MIPAPLEYLPAPPRVEPTVVLPLPDPGMTAGYRSVWIAVALYCALQITVIAWTIPSLLGLFS